MSSPDTLNLDKLKKLKEKGPLFYIRLKAEKIKRRNRFFGWLFQTFFSFYKIGDIKISVDSELYPLPLYSRFFFHIYEMEEVKVVNKYLKGTETVLELGGSIGVVSCVVNRLLNQPEKQVVVEANPNLISHLTKNKNINQCSFNIVNGVVSDEREVKFYTNNNALSGSMIKEMSYQENSDHFREHKLKGISPFDIEKQFRVSFDTLIMDIEGGEYEFIRNYPEWINKLSLLIIEFHPRALKNGDSVKKYIQLLKDNCNFRLFEEQHGTYVFKK